MKDSNKSAIRERILRTRDNLSEAEREEKSAKIAARVLELSQFRAARSLLFYASFRSEVETEDLIRRSLKMGKTVALPLANSERRELEIRKIADVFVDLGIGAYGIKEPLPEKTETLPLEQIDLAIVPGVAFDKEGHRLGWGAGYYDRFLRSLPVGVPLIALAFDLQVVDSIPAQPHDVAVDKIVTEKRVIECRARA